MCLHREDIYSGNKKDIECMYALEKLRLNKIKCLA